MNDKAFIEWILQTDSLDTNNTNIPPTVAPFNATFPSNSLEDTSFFNLLLEDPEYSNAQANVSSEIPSDQQTRVQRQQAPSRPAPKGVPQEQSSVLDFRPANDHVPEAQLKAMTSTERRQLRNKISARNFRNRRKEYISSLEEQVDKKDAEISQLRLEVKWARENNEILRKENNTLKIELVILRGHGPTNNSQLTLSPADMPSLAVTSSSDSSFSSPPNLFDISTDDWDFALPEETHLSHAVTPHWDFSSILSKGRSEALPPPGTLFQQFPLLAPALMSIVVSHTMTMTTAELLAGARLADSQNALTVRNNPTFQFKQLPKLSHQEMENVWELLSQPKSGLVENVKEEHTSSEVEEKDDEEDAEENDEKEETSTADDTANESKSYISPYCPLTWIQQTFFQFICKAMLEQEPRTQSWCNVPMPICDRLRRKILSSS
ncbi:hypothetical protein DFQ28_011497 [Apophysomyces sp. BC1034]|nr:hypothetical protein DFQ30_011162 [Apophysomyces sp. BC1015]KAG0181127.1 hypothetical protein DFQ29_009286 [Apophysomyces sp. BC1021]KAG0191584.1 hypothetical protein DFQ28_011497 [Apophysomyces sp. BC1034]